MPTSRKNLFASWRSRHLGVLGAIFLCVGCQQPAPPKPEPHINLAPSTQPSAQTLNLDKANIQPMYREALAIDLPAVARIATAKNLDIQLARQRVDLARGHLDAAYGQVFPVLIPSVGFDNVNGTVRATQGNPLPASYNAFTPAIAAQIVVNPGKVIYDIIAAKKRVMASEYEQRAVALESLRQSASQYYDLILAQSTVAAARQTLAEADETLRIARLREKTGTALSADTLRAESRQAARRQELLAALNQFFDASVALALTLHLDSTITLIPASSEVQPTTLVREDLAIDDLLKMALDHNPDLKRTREIIAAVTAEKKSAIWSGFGPTLQTGYQYGGVSGHAEHIGTPPHSEDFGLHRQEHFSAGASERLDLSTFGTIKSASASERQAILEAQQHLDRVRAQVVLASQSARTSAALVDASRQELATATEALRLARVNLKAGNMTMLDVLQAEDLTAQSRIHYAAAIVKYNQAQIQLLSAMGLLDEQSLNPR